MNEIVAADGNDKYIVDFYGATNYGSDYLMFFELMGVSLEEYVQDKQPRDIDDIIAIGHQVEI